MQIAQRRCAVRHTGHKIMFPRKWWCFKKTNLGRPGFEKRIRNVAEAELLFAYLCIMSICCLAVFFLWERVVAFMLFVYIIRSQILGVFLLWFFFLSPMFLGMISADRNPNDSNKNESMIEICPMKPGLVPWFHLPESSRSGGHNDLRTSKSCGGETGMLNCLCW